LEQVKPENISTIQEYVAALYKVAKTVSELGKEIEAIKESIVSINACLDRQRKRINFIEQAEECVSDNTKRGGEYGSEFLD